MDVARGLRGRAGRLGGLLLGLCSGCRAPAAPRPDAGHGVDWAAVTERAPVTGDLLVNGGFEGGLAPWFAPDAPGWSAGEVVTGVAHGGTHSLLARVRGQAGSTPERRWGAMFAVGSVPFPQYASLWYRVDRWEASDALQYLLFAVLVESGGQSYQVRYFLAGPDAVPYNDKGNFRVVTVHKGPPELGRWVHFTADLHRDFRERWGRVPASFGALRFAVEARYDTRDRPLARDVAADVYFDDVYVGFSPPPERE